MGENIRVSCDICYTVTNLGRVVVGENNRVSCDVSVTQ